MRAAIPGGPCRAHSRPCPRACCPLLPTAIPGGDPGHATPAAYAGARARSCLPPGHVAGAVNRPGGRSIRRRSWTRPDGPGPGGDPRRPAAELPRRPAPRPWPPMAPPAIRAPLRRAPGRAAPAPRPAPSRGRYAPQDATPTGLLLPRNAQRQRATHPRTPAPLRHAPRAPARPRAPALASRRALARPRVYARARFRV